MGTTASAVSRALTAGGEAKSEWHASGMVKGYGTSTRGFKAANVTRRVMVEDYRKIGRGRDARWGNVMAPKNEPTGEVVVEWLPGSWPLEKTEEARLAVAEARLASYVAILTAKGFKAEIKTDPYNGRRRVHVTKD